MAPLTTLFASAISWGKSKDYRGIAKSCFHLSLISYSHSQSDNQSARGSPKSLAVEPQPFKAVLTAIKGYLTLILKEAIPP